MNEQHDHNSAPARNDVDDDAVLAFNLGKLRHEIERFASATGEFRAGVKSIEAKGLDIGIAKEALRIVKAGRVPEKIAELATLSYYLRLLGAPVTEQQLSLFSVSPDGAPLDETARDVGRIAALTGEGEGSCPHDPTTAAYRSWIAGFDQGQSEVAIIMSMNSNVSPIVGRHEDEDEDEDALA